MKDIREKILSDAEKTVRLLVPNRIGIISALSGGADSVCLLLVLKELCHRHGLALSAVHVNHNLRGEESMRDQRFCENLCDRLGIPLCVKSVDVRGYMAQKGMSLETAARELRYKAFSELQKRNREFIATAHNLDDNAETILLNLTRGTGLRGLCGIQPVREDGVIRPLLYTTRAEIEDFLSQQHQDYVTDSTNLEDDCSRNKIRHNVIPVLKEINPGFLENIKRTVITLSEDEYCLENSDQDDFPAEKKRIIADIMRKNDIGITRDRLDRIYGLEDGGAAHISRDIYAVASNGSITFEKRTRYENAADYSVPFAEGDTILPDGRHIIIKQADSEDVNNLLTNKSDYCGRIKVGGSENRTVIRTRRENDRIVLQGEKIHRRIRKLHNAKKIPPHLRETAAVIADDENILWEEYCGVSECAYTGNTAVDGKVYDIFMTKRPADDLSDRQSNE